MRRMNADFLDTNVILYLLDDSPKVAIAEQLIASGSIISVQVLNEALVNCIRKAGMSWQEAGQFIDGVSTLCPVVDMTPTTHKIGRALGERYGLSVYDAMIVAAALENQCTTIYSEDMHHGLVVEGQLKIVNPFKT